MPIMQIEIASQDVDNGEAKVSDKAEWYLEQLPEWKRADDLMAGTKAMRRGGSAYLDKLELESQNNYERRLKSTVLTNFYKDHFHTAMGLIFAEDIVLSEDCTIPPDHIANIDNRGHSLQQFAQMLAARLLWYGMVHTFVDMPPNEGAESKADDIAMGLRPYWVLLNPDKVFNAFFTMEKNVRELTQLRFTTCKTSVTGFAKTETKAIKVYYDDDLSPSDECRFETWLQDQNKEYILSSDAKDNGVLKLDEIPLVTFATSDEEFMESQSIMSDIAFKNVEHWSSSSDQRNILTVTRYPLQYQIGTDKVIDELGAGGILHSTGTSHPKQPVEFGYIEPKGESVQSGERDLDRIVQDANVLSIRLRQGEKGSQTATGDVLDFSLSSSPLHMVANALEKGLNECLSLHAKWMGKGINGGTVKVSKDFGISASESARITEIGTARRFGDLDRGTYLNEMVQMGVFKTDVSEDKISEALTKENTGMFGNVPPLNDPAATVKK